MLIIQLADLNRATIDFSLLPDAVIDEANQRQSSQRKKQFLVCRSILASLLKQYYQLPILPSIILGDNNRPQFANPDLPDFNISHSQNFVAVAIRRHGRIGLDIELARTRNNYLAVANTFFSKEENAWLAQQVDPLHAFWQLWTLKESALKLYAKGVWQMKSVIVNPKTDMISAPFADHFYYHYQQVGDIHLSVSSNCHIDDLRLLT
ncbi:4'-phosphopantetheinyl transferase superfamily protein [Orbaceae bacterium ESL0727]|nr:4'-phosphopantetheinyl transferase superfamily protein [Orbaceae bacterium ESL0727]